MSLKVKYTLKKNNILYLSGKKLTYFRNCKNGIFMYKSILDSICIDSKFIGTKKDIEDHYNTEAFKVTEDFEVNMKWKLIGLYDSNNNLLSAGVRPIFYISSENSDKLESIGGVIYETHHLTYYINNIHKWSFINSKIGTCQNKLTALHDYYMSKLSDDLKLFIHFSNARTHMDYY